MKICAACRNRHLSLSALLAAAFLGLSSVSDAASVCSTAPGKLRSTDQAQWNGWGVTPDNRRFQRSTDAGLRASDLPRLRLKWAFAFDGATMAYGQPTVIGRSLYVGGETGKVYSLDARTGCERWRFEAGAGVRTGIVVGRNRRNGSRLLYFGDQKGSVYALDAATGALRWKVRADPHPAAIITGTPQLWRGRLYVPVASSEENFAS